MTFSFNSNQFLKYSRLVYDYLQMQKQISNYTSDNEVPTNYKEIDELMNVSTINEKLSDDDFNIIIMEFKSSVIKNAQELKGQVRTIIKSMLVCEFFLFVKFMLKCIKLTKSN